ncbi:MAG: J domain-containing protein [Myxococcota bacterium]|nr:J domain-containing protein [Myxococcota bacterium]
MRETEFQKVRKALEVLFGCVDVPMPERVDKDILKSAYRERVFQCHPDRAVARGGVEPGAESKTRTINVAYSILKKKMAEGEITTRTYYPRGQSKRRETRYPAVSQDGEIQFTKQYVKELMEEEVHLEAFRTW